MATHVSAPALESTRALDSAQATCEHGEALCFYMCGESNLCGIVDAQIAVVEDELLARNTLGS